MALLQDSTDTSLSWDTMLPHALKLSELLMDRQPVQMHYIENQDIAHSRLISFTSKVLHAENEKRIIDRGDIVDQHWLQRTLTGHAEVNNHGNYVPSWQSSQSLVKIEIERFR